MLKSDTNNKLYAVVTRRYCNMFLDSYYWYSMEPAIFLFIFVHNGELYIT